MLLATLVGLLQLASARPAGSDDAASGDAVRAARDAQTRFERIRRAHLPRRSYGWGGACHARVGRFCYFYDPADTVVPPEPQRIQGARDALLRTLDSLATAAPSSGWITGQRVRYLIEANRGTEAVAAATGCRAEPWWCAALTGLAMQVDQQYTAADSAFADALAGMPRDQRCEWLDLADVVRSDWGRGIRTADCALRERLAEQAWSLGQPLWMLRHNDLRTEHFARHTMTLLLEHSANVRGQFFGSDNRELLLRYGWAEWFTREDLGSMSNGTYSITGHDAEPSFHFFPTTRGHPLSWRPGDTLAPSRYAPRHIDGLDHLPHQLARFPRGDSMLLVTAFDSGADSREEGAMAIHDGERVRVLSRGVRHLAGMVAADTVVVGVEHHDARRRHARRARYSLAPLACAEWCLSDLLFTAVGSDTGVFRSPVAAAAHALSEPRIRAGEPVGVFFELARPAAALQRSSVSFTLAVTPIRISRARRLATALRLASRPDAVRLHWDAVLEPGGGLAPQHVTLRVPPGARGNYRVHLTVTPRGATPLHAERDLTVER